MLIEKGARRYIVQAIKCDQELRVLEINERLKGRIILRTPQYDISRKKFIEICNQINSIANTQGKGRSDLKIEILLEAEDTLRKVTEHRSKAIRKLCEQIKVTFNGLRNLFKKYSENIEAVDPQLKNNTDLSEALLAFERAWEKGKEFLLNKTTKETLLSMSELIEGLVEKHKEIVEKIEAMDADIFIMLPSLSILKSIDNNTQSYKDSNQYEQLKGMYKKLKAKTKGYELYNTMERMILEKAVEKKLSDKVRIEDINKLLHNIKELAIVIQRANPTEWNTLMETSIGIV